MKSPQISQPHHPSFDDFDTFLAKKNGTKVEFSKEEIHKYYNSFKIKVILEFSLFDHKKKWVKSENLKEGSSNIKIIKEFKDACDLNIKLNKITDNTQNVWLNWSRDTLNYGTDLNQLWYTDNKGRVRWVDLDSVYKDVPGSMIAIE